MILALRLCCAMIVQAQDDMPSKAVPQDSCCEYEATIHTADMQGAGTDADVSLVMFGTSGEHAEHHKLYRQTCAWYKPDHGVVSTPMHCTEG